MIVRYSARSVADIEAIAAYVGERNPQAAVRVRAAISRVIDNLAVFPLFGREANDDGMRRIGVRRYPYTIFYTVDLAAGQVQIASIHHNSRRPEYADT